MQTPHHGKMPTRQVENFGYPEEWIPKIVGGNAARLLRRDTSNIAKENQNDDKIK
jgi:predicted TIM-barrel fold metal-dependent hydrolase